MLADISVIIPAYNRAGLIGETLRSLVNQTVQAKEIILVDDGSTDGTAEAVEREFSVFREQFSGNSISKIQNLTFKFLRQANAGPGAARNRGLAEATGEFIHFFDSDDIAAPNKQKVQLRALLDSGADIAYGPWVKGRFVENERPMTDGGELMADSAGGAKALDARLWTLDAGPLNFVPEGPVLQARGLPEGYLIKALLTNWSIVPHACLFRRSILEKAGGFPEDIWVGEDQLLFLRCLLAGARVVHTPGTMVYYRVGNDPGKLTAAGAAQKRHAKDWGRFLLKANKAVTSGEWQVTRVEEKNSTTIERQGGREKEQPKVGPKGEGVGTTESNHTNLHENGEKVSTTDNTDGHGCQKSQPGDAQGTCAGASESDSLTSKLFDSPVSESLTRCASAPASSLSATSHSLLAIVPEAPSPATAPTALTPATSCSLPFTHRPSAWFGFRLRAYEAWRDLEKFFPHGEGELKNELQGIWKKNRFSGLGFQVLGFVFRKLGGLKFRIMGYREHASFKCAEFSASSEN